MNAPETGPLSGRLEQLAFDNSFAGLPEAFYTRLAPLGLPAPYLVGASDEVAELIGLDPGEFQRPEFCEIFAGNNLPPGSDALAVSVAPIVVSDSGVGDDTPGISVALTLADAGAGSETLLTSVLLTVADAAAGTDAVGSITVNVAVDDIGQAVDVLGQIDAVLSVLDLGTGVDVVVRFDSAVRLVKVVFTLARRAMAFAWSARSVVFAWTLRAVEFAGPAPSMEFSWSERTIEFALNS